MKPTAPTGKRECVGHLPFYRLPKMRTQETRCPLSEVHHREGLLPKNRGHVSQCCFDHFERYAWYHRLMITGVFSPQGAPHDEANFSNGPGMFGCPFRAYCFWGRFFPWRCHGLEVNCPFRGVRFGGSPHRLSEKCGMIDPLVSHRHKSRNSTQMT
jgi:hypothetical protein